MKKLLMLAALLALTSCTDSDRSAQALRSQGFTEIQITGYSPWSCGEGDAYATGFRAKNPQGLPVSGTVCCGVMKSCTVRW